MVNSPAILNFVADISEAIGRYTAIADRYFNPQLRRENRIRTIHASPAMENNTLTLEQVTAVIDGKHVLGHPRYNTEIKQHCHPVAGPAYFRIG